MADKWTFPGSQCIWFSESNIMYEDPISFLCSRASPRLHLSTILGSPSFPCRNPIFCWLLTEEMKLPCTPSVWRSLSHILPPCPLFSTVTTIYIVSTPSILASWLYKCPWLLSKEIPILFVLLPSRKLLVDLILWKSFPNVSLVHPRHLNKCKPPLSESRTL